MLVAIACAWFICAITVVAVLLEIPASVAALGSTVFVYALSLGLRYA